MKIKRLKRIFKLTLKLIVAALLWLLVFVSEWGFYFVGVFFTFTENWIAAIMSLLFALVMEIKTVANKKTRRPKDIVEKVKRARFDAVTVRYGRTFTHENQKERSAFQTGFDYGCDFILNLEDK